MHLSIIVPICNVEKYLAECLESILKQDVQDMEVICVNDGSTDSSLSIINDFAQKDSRIKIIDKPNSGYGDSLNKGIEAACGDYIGIVESDDVVCDGIFEKMLANAMASDADLVKGCFNFFESSTGELRLHPNFKDFSYNKVISIKNNSTLFFTAPAVWSAFYKKTYLLDNDIKFLPTPGASYQDTAFAFKVWAKAERIYLMEEPVINYRVDTVGSSSNVSKKIFNIFNETQEMKEFLEKNNLLCYYPEFVKTKFISYTWTLARLNQKDKIKFLLKWIPELQFEFSKGYFRKEFWDDYNWNLIHSLVFDFERTCGFISQNQIVDFNFPNKGNLIKNASPVYIYGAGKFGVKALNFLQEKGIRVTAFIVSDINSNPANIEGIPVIGLDRIDRDGLIFIGVSEKFKAEVFSTLKSNWLFNNVFEM